MEWGNAILVVEILLLVAGWLLFQQAKSDLTARAAQVPVLAEIKALQKSIAALIEQIKLESSQASAQLEARCLEARDLLAALDRSLESSGCVDQRASARVTVARNVGLPSMHSTSEPAETSGRDTRFDQIYALSDDGLAATAISQRSGFSEGEVELILGLRKRPA